MNLNIRTRLTLQFTVIVAGIFVLFSAGVYYFSSTFRESEFYNRLKSKALFTARLLIEVNEVDYGLLKIIDKNSINALYSEKVLIYDYKNKQIYNSLDDDSIVVSNDLLNQIRIQKEVRFTQSENEVIGLLYQDKLNRFVVIASAIDKYGKSKLRNLRAILTTGLLISILITTFAGRNYSRRALKPISRVINEADLITISSLYTRVHEGNGRDEIAQLAITFNKMLKRLESAFEMQKSFVSNASHELRTPLTSITGQIEVSLMKLRTEEEYAAILQSVLEDIIKLNKLSNGLLDLARASSDISEISFRKLRIDELIWETSAELTKRKEVYKIGIHFNESVDDEEKLSVFGNEQLLKTAIINLMDNGCKYSEDKTMNITLDVDTKQVIVRFSDNGIGIDEDEIAKIFQPFFRARNARNISGNGLGLSLTEKIIAIHNGEILIDSVLNKGTTITVKIPFM